jgi:hypothetical protein
MTRYGSGTVTSEESLIVSNVLPAPADSWAPSGKVAGYAIGSCALLTMLAIAMHPQAASRNVGDFVIAVARLTPMLRIVHGTVIAFMLALLYGFTVYSLRRGLRREAVVGALVAYAAGVGVLILAALIDGFLIPLVAARYAGVPPDVLRVGAGVLTLCGAAIQVLSKFGVIAMSAAIALWSTDLLRSGGALRIAGIVGCAAALIPVGVLFAAGQLVPMTLTIIVVAQGIWYLTIATLLVREQV